MSAVNGDSLRKRLSACVSSSVSKDCKWEVNAAPRSQIGEAAPLAGARNGRAISEQNRVEFVTDERLTTLFQEDRRIALKVFWCDMLGRRFVLDGPGESLP
jgi:hypothetical protein